MARYKAILENDKALSNEGKLKISHYLFALALFAKQFYLLPSGSFQIGDALFVLSFVCVLFESKGMISFGKNDGMLFAYFGCVAIINLLYTLFEGHNYNKSTLYYVFNLVVVMCFLNLCTPQNTKKFLSLVAGTSKASLIFQLLTFVSGMGRWYASSRYQGTFNDPNQYGVFILFSLYVVALVSIYQQKRAIIWILLSTFLIFLCSSTGMLLGLFVFLAFYILSNPTKNKYFTIFSLVFISALFVLLICIANGTIVLDFSSLNSPMLNRITGKINGFLISDGSGSIITDRGWARVFEYPEYILFGAGEGGYERFGVNLEIHSSILGPLFYYGIFPFFFFVRWCVLKIRSLGSKYYCVYFGLIAESIFLVNTRQPLYWTIFLLAGAIAKSAKQDEGLI